jgi:hypothetical protein
MKPFHTAWKCALLVVVLTATGCISTQNSPDAAALPPTELRAIQTRTYALRDQQAMMKVVLDVLQDDGFIIDYAHTEMGILHGTKTITGTGDLLFNVTSDFFPGAAGPRANGAAAKIDATANLTQLQNATKVRISLQRINTYLSGYFGYNSAPNFNTQAGPIVDAKIYQEFFAKLDRGLFLHNQGL